MVCDVRGLFKVERQVLDKIVEHDWNRVEIKAEIWDKESRAFSDTKDPVSVH
ncbi:uncharacterized protein G2W53_040287 [Senna tora]|uniref:Uncharacterized protein n=1 Tax=Senna tora TaxID=362788 RepID=A0A834SRB9_9FABA|nr:uncharacterized protein G2W53_040287 [Senna tora]